MASYGVLAIRVTADTRAMSAQIASDATAAGNTAAQTIGRQVTTGVGGALSNVASQVGGAVTKAASVVGSGISRAASAAWSAASAGAGMLARAAGSAASTVSSTFGRAWSAVTSAAGRAASAASAAFARMPGGEAIQNSLGRAWSAVSSAAGRAASAAGAGFSRMAGSAGSALQNSLGRAWSATSSAAGRAASAAGAGMARMAGSAGSAIQSGIGKAFSAVTSAGTRAANSIGSAFAEMQAKTAAKKEAGGGGGLLGTLTALPGVAKVGAIGMGVLGGSIISAGVSFNTLQQKSRAAFATILGSQKAADKMMGDIAAFAKTSPFPRQAFISAAQQMASFGVQTQKIVPYLKSIQDSVAATGGNAQDLSDITLVMSQIQAAGKITGVDLMQFAQRGINAADLIGSSMGKTGTQIKEQITNGSLDATTALDALSKGMDKKFGGSADKVKTTFAGTMDSVKGAMRDMGAALVAPFIDPKGGGYAVTWGNALSKALRQIIPAVTLVMTGLAKVITVLGTGLAAAVGWAQKFSGWLVPIAGGIMAMVVAYKLWTLALKIGVLWTNLVTLATNAWAAAQAILNAVLAANPIGIVVLALIGLAAAIYLAWTRSAAFRNFVIMMWDGIKVAASAAWSVIQVVFSSMLSAAQAVIGWIIRNWPLLVGVMTGPLGIAVVMIIRYWGTIQSVIGSVLNWIKATASAVWGWLVSFTSAVWSAVTSTIIGAATSVRNAVTGAWNNMLAVIRSVQAAITGAITSAFNWVKSAFVGTWTFAQQVTARLWAAIAGVITWWFGRVMNSLTNWFNWIKGAMSAVWGFLQAVTTRAWSGLANTIETGWARVKGATTAALTWIRETMQRAWDMIKGAAGSAWTAIAGAIGTAWDKVKNAVAAPVRWIVRSVINPLVKGINTLITKIGMPAIPTVPGFAEGGRIPGGWGGGDTQLIVAEPGEWVLTKRQAKGMGYGWLRTLPRFADGGMVGGGPSGDGGPSPMLGWPGWANPADWGSAIAGGAVKAWKEVVAAGKGVVDEFSGMLRWAAAEAFKAMTAPLRKGAEAMGKSKQLFPSAYMGKLVVSVIDHAVSFIESKAVPEGSGVGGIAELAQTFNGHRYIWGGGANEKTGFDCSSFINMLAGMTGLPTPGGFKAPSNIHGPVTGDWLGWSGMKTIKLGQIQPGDIAVNSHHIILSIGMKGEGFAARSTATGTGPQRITNAYTVRRWPGPGPGGSGAYMGAFSMGAGLGPIVAGSRSQNLVTIARALMGLGWSATGAAGAAGNIYQESWGDPLAAGTGGRGLIGWTPPGRLPNAAFVPGNPSLSLQRQIPLASQFFKSNMGKYWALAQRQVDPGKSALIIMNMGERPAGSSQSNPFFGGSSTSKGGLRASVARQVFDQLRRMAGKGMARGGILREEIAGIGSSGQLYHLAEGGRPEAIVPLSGSAVEVAASTQPTRSLTINVYPRANQSERDIAAAVSRELAWAQAGGTL